MSLTVPAEYVTKANLSEKAVRDVLETYQHIDSGNQHVCIACMLPIPVGESHYRVIVRLLGWNRTVYTHILCAEYRTTLSNAG